MKKLLTLGALAFAATPLLAQNEDLLRRLLVTDGVDIGAEFLIAVVAGVVIAFATQYLLTALSVAVGISAVPDLKKTYAKAKARDPERGRAADQRDWDDFDREADDTPTGVKVSAAAGAWNLVTTAVALFTGAAFALTLAPVLLLAPQLAVTVALVIWGLFFITLFWLESRFASTIVGGLVSAATSGLKAAAQGLSGAAGGVASLATPSPETRVRRVAESTIDELDARFGDRFDADRIVAAIEGFTEETSRTVKRSADDLAAELPSYAQLKDDLRAIALDSAEAGKPPKSNPAKWTAIQTVVQSAIDSRDGADTAQGERKSTQLKRLLAELRGEYERTGSAAETVESVVGDHADEEYVDKIFARIQDSLKSLPANGEGGDDADADDRIIDAPTDGGGGAPAGGDSGGRRFDVATIQRELEGVLGGRDMNGSTATVKERLRSIDREQVVALVADNTSLSREQVEQYAEQAEKAVALVSEKLGATEEGGADGGIDLTDVAGRARAAIASFLEAHDPTGGQLTELARGDTDAVDLGRLRGVIVGALTGSGSAAGGDTLGALSRKLRSFDRDAVVDLLTSNTALTRAQLADYGRTLDEAVAEVRDRVTRLGNDSRAAVRNAERRAAIEAEHARRTAASAAWWLVLCIVVSGAAAVAGALLGGL